ncbi:MAG: 3-deoxy-D-manno-octulosonic acid kinase [Bacteroidetes bacterium]|nr:3-deoxy-D-manno-octulosonic acid kinase [Bacteroidota bacterium]
MIYQDPTIPMVVDEKYFSEKFWFAKEGYRKLKNGRGSSIVCHLRNKKCVLRNFLRGGFIAFFLYDKYLWLGLSRSRVFNEFLVLKHAQKERVLVPEFVAYHVERHGLFYSQSIITQFIENRGTLAEILNRRGLSRAEWKLLAGSIKAMHKASINHVDLNANNILYGNDDQFYIIDFDKAQVMTDEIRWPEKNIGRLLRSLKKESPKYFNLQQSELLEEEVGALYAEIAAKNSVPR